MIRGMMARIPVLPAEIQQRVDAELKSGEKLVWANQPLPGLFARRAIGAVLFGIIFAGFAVSWVGTASTIGHSTGPGIFSFFPLFGVPFILIGMGMMSAPFWARRKALRTVYALTDRRAIIIEQGIFGSVSIQSFLPSRLTSMTRKERMDGTGDLVFVQFTQPAGSGTTTVRKGFMAVSRVREVEDLIISTLLSDRVRAVGSPGSPSV